MISEILKLVLALMVLKSYSVSILFLLLSLELLLISDFNIINLKSNLLEVVLYLLKLIPLLLVWAVLL